MLSKLPKEGFVKTTRPRQPDLSSEQRAALIRKGNQLYQAGKIEEAKRIFLTTGYTDGIVRIGDIYFNKYHDYLEALRLYWIAPAPGKAETIIQRMAGVIQTWLTQENSTVEGNTKEGTK
ncbi:MAG: hypothetical protein K9L68_00575 [Spirochaetales bacterium]|nr:hypothetical protein [Spirochaetales bacterium]MCF7937070.1 hypothetical protein [Spirochaetales bacterium]